MKPVLMTWVMLFALAVNAHGDGLLAEADALYETRGENFNSETLVVDPANIQKAIELYTATFDQLSGAEKEEACWKLIRASYFMGQYAETNGDKKKEVYDLGKNAGAKGLEEFPESVGIHAWMAIIWGVWGEENGLLQSARQGVAGKIRAHCEKVIELDDRFQDATGYRVLGRLHYKAPKIPLILGWPSKEKAVEYLEKAYAIAPQNLHTKQYLAEALYERGQQDRARQLLQEIIATNDTVLGVVEDAYVKNYSTELSAQWDER